MNIQIKQLFQEQDFSRYKLAEMLNTTEEMIQLWENGEREIPSRMLKDMAVIFRCSVDDILGLTKQGRTYYYEMFAREFEKKSGREIIGYYGGIKLTLQGIKTEKDYPVDEQAAQYFLNSFPQLHDEPTPGPWRYIETLNNYILFINIKAVKMAQLYENSMEAAPPYENPEVYRILTDWDSSEDLTIEEISESFDISEPLAEIIKSLVPKYHNSGYMFDDFHYATVYWLDGTETSHYINEALCSDLYFLQDPPYLGVVYGESNPDELTELRFLEDGHRGEVTTFLNLAQIALIEVPAIKFWQVYCEENPDSLEYRGLSPYLPLPKSISSEKLEAD